MPTNLKSKAVKAVGYRFDELNSEAKERVQSRLWEMEMEYQDWYESVIEMFAKDLEEWGIAIDTRPVELRSGKIRHDPEVYFDVSLMKSRAWAAFGAYIPDLRKTFESLSATDFMSDELNAEWQAAGRRLLEKHGPLLDELAAAGIEAAARIVDTEHYWSGHKMSVESDILDDIVAHTEYLWEDEEAADMTAVNDMAMTVYRMAANADGKIAGDPTGFREINRGFDLVRLAIAEAYAVRRRAEQERLEKLADNMLADTLEIVQQMAGHCAGMLAEEEEWLGSEEHARDWADANDVWFTAEGHTLFDYEPEGGE